MDKADEILEVVSFMKKRMVTKDELATLEERMATKEDLTVLEEQMATKEGLARVELKVDGVINRLDDELDKRKVLEVRVGRLENTR